MTRPADSPEPQGHVAPAKPKARMSVLALQEQARSQAEVMKREKAKMKALRTKSRRRKAAEPHNG